MPPFVAPHFDCNRQPNLTVASPQPPKPELEALQTEARRNQATGRRISGWLSPGYQLKYQWPGLHTALPLASDDGGCTDCKRGARRYAWRPTSCELPSWDAQLFCKALGNRSLLIVGDSTAVQLASTLGSMVVHSASGRPQHVACGRRVALAQSDTLLGECLGGYNRGTTLARLVQHYQPNLVLISVGAHVSELPRPERTWESMLGGQATNATRTPLCGTAEKMSARTNACRLCALKGAACPGCTDWQSLPTAGSAVAAMERVLASVTALIGTLRRAGQHSKTAPRPPRFIWKGSSPAHMNCSAASNLPPPVAFSGYPPQSMYNWWAAPRFDAMAQAAAVASGGELHFLDTSMLYTRPDAHISRDDCMHFCTPGPLDDIARVLLAMLMVGEV